MITRKATIIDRVTKEDIETLYYTDKNSLNEIALILGCAYSTVHRLFDHYGIRKRTRREGRSLLFEKRSNVDVEFFKNDSPELYYVLGLWASDGCVTDGGTMSLSMTDCDVIQWVAQTIDYKNTIMQYKPKNSPNSKVTYSIVFTNNEVFHILKERGITPRKSLSIRLPEIPYQYTKDFVRGVFDGDGSIYVGRRKDNNARCQKFSLVSGSREFLEGLNSLIYDALQVGPCKITVDCRRANPLYEIGVSKREDVVKIAKWMYSGDAFGMARKKTKMIALCDSEAVRRGVVG
ncbi:LAGLIDADG family homing endonuclease [Brevibacillus panacihumi]|uniref:LAGLIDADG family homing endonuclease n=1 Tax=Brevibacillus panacihumi TaxID=497735 RepID=UPI003CFF164E